MSFCPKCGAQVKDGAQFCHVCGFSMATQNSEPTPNTQQSNNPFNTPIPPIGSVNPSNIFTRAMNIMFKPKSEWQAIEAETPNTSSILFGYVIPLALIPAIFTIIGYGVIGYKVGFGPWSYSVKSWSMGISAGLTSFIASVAGVYIVALIVDALATSFKGQKNFGRAMQLVAYSFTPVWIIGVLNIFPPLAVLGILGLYGLYLMYVGFEHTMKPAKESLVGYYLATLGITIVTYIILGLILGLILSAIFVTSAAAYNMGAY
jgi:hypothetical protein